MATADFGLSGWLENVPQVELGGLVPDPVRAFSPLTDRQPRLIVNAPRAQTALQNKWSGYMQTLAAEYDPTLINAMMDFDAQRVKNGQSPLSEDETRAALEAARTRTQVTPEPQRSISTPWAVAGNAIKDIGDIVKAIPRMPLALVHEAQAIPQIPEAMKAGPNPLAGLAQAPGIRLLPGAFVVGSVASGQPGELLRHPVMTALDVLPAANVAAKATGTFRAVDEVVQAARRGRETTTLSTRDFRQLDRMADRPISTAMFNRIGEDGLPVRSPAGEFVDNIRSTRLGQFLTQHFGRTQQDLMFGLNRIPAEGNAVLEGKLAPRNEIEAITKAAHDFRAQLGQIDPTLTSVEGMDRMSAIWQAMDDDIYTGLDDAQLAAISVYNTEILPPLTDWTLRNSRNLEYGGEVYDIKTGTMLREARARVQERETLHTVRNAILGGDPMDAVGILTQRLRAPGKKPGRRGRMPAIERARSIEAGEVGAKELLLSWRGTRQALRNAGHDTGILDELASKKGGGIASGRFQRAIEDLHEGRIQLDTMDSMTMEQVLEYAKLHSGESIAYRDLVNGIARHEWKGVTDALDSLRGADPAFVRGVRNLRDTARLMDNSTFKQATLDGVATAKGSLGKLEMENLPARFKPKAQEITRDIVARKLIEVNQDILDTGTAASVEAILRARDAGELAGIPGFTERMYSQAQKEAARTVMAMKADGFDPIFRHSVTPNRVEQSLRFGENIVPVDAQATKLRRDNMAPTLKDITVSINDHAMQFMSEGVREAQLHWIADNYGYTLAELNTMFHEPARWRAGKSSALNYEGHKTKLITERYRALDPEELGYNWGSPYVNQLKSEQIYVPMEVYKNLKSLTDPHSILGGIFDPITKTFRIATTGLSLRTQMYNMVGGMVSTFLQSPTALFKYGNEARAMMRDHTLIPEEMVGLIGSQKRTMLELDDLQKGKVVEGVRKYMVGEKMRGWWDEAQARKTPGKPITGRFGEKFKGLVEKSYDFNGMFDDYYRMVAYLDEYNKGIAKGYTAEVAGYRAMGVARRILQDYLGMTPFERNIVKSLIPFYGFIGHAMRYVLRYPFDHPLRAEMMAKLAAAEMEDHSMGLPTRFMSNLFFGGMDDKGNQRAFNLGPFNPFGDVANSMTVAGFLGNTNPVLQTAFEMVGLDRGKAELYPSLRYDAETGRMAAETPGFFQALTGNIVPQSAALLAIMGLNGQYNEMLQRDPSAAGRYLLSTLTIPMVERQFNVPQEQFAAELARRKSANSVLNAALKSGNWKEAMRYPSLVKYLEALDELPPEQLQAFQPIDRSQAFAMAKDAFAGLPQTTQTSAAPVAPGTNVPQVPLDDIVMAQMQQVALGPSPSPQPGQSVGANAAGGALGTQGI